MLNAWDTSKSTKPTVLEMLRDFYRMIRPSVFMHKPAVALFDEALAELENKAERNAKIKKDTGHDSMEEWVAYDKGREDEQKAFLDWIQTWDGTAGGAIGRAITIRMTELKCERATHNKKYPLTPDECLSPTVEDSQE